MESKELPLDKDLFFDLIQLCSKYQRQKDVIKEMEVLLRDDFKDKFLIRIKKAVKTRDDVTRVNHLLELLKNSTNIDPLKEIIPEIVSILQ